MSCLSSVRQHCGRVFLLWLVFISVPQRSARLRCALGLFIAQNTPRIRRRLCAARKILRCLMSRWSPKIAVEPPSRASCGYLWGELSLKAWKQCCLQCPKLRESRARVLDLPTYLSHSQAHENSSRELMATRRRHKRRAGAQRGTSEHQRLALVSEPKRVIALRS